LQGLERNTNLTSINLFGNDLAYKTNEAINNVLQLNKTLSEVNLAKNFIKPDQLEQVSLLLAGRGNPDKVSSLKNLKFQFNERIIKDTDFVVK